MWQANLLVLRFVAAFAGLATVVSAVAAQETPRTFQDVTATRVDFASVKRIAPVKTDLTKEEVWAVRYGTAYGVQPKRPARPPRPALWFTSRQPRRYISEPTRAADIVSVEGTGPDGFPLWTWKVPEESNGYFIESGGGVAATKLRPDDGLYTGRIYSDLAFPTVVFNGSGGLYLCQFQADKGLLWQRRLTPFLKDGDVKYRMEDYATSADGEYTTVVACAENVTAQHGGRLLVFDKRGNLCSWTDFGGVGFWSDLNCLGEYYSVNADVRFSGGQSFGARSREGWFLLTKSGEVVGCFDSMNGEPRRNDWFLSHNGSQIVASSWASGKTYLYSLKP